ncbi:hypothetical protein WMF30_08085 [Sorangium sp. So ce134]
MTILAQLQPGIVRVVKSVNGQEKEIGYAFTVETGNGGQLQRWLLYEDPKNEFEIRPASNKMDGWTTLQHWQTFVNNTLRPKWSADSIYIWAQSNVYLPGGTYNGVVWGNGIPLASLLPPPTYHAVYGTNVQTDHTAPFAIEIRQVGIQKSVLCGLTFTAGSLANPSSVEYWVLSPSYQAAGAPDANSVTSIKTGTGFADTLDDFIALANQSWTSNSRFVITGCINFRHPDGPPAVL